MTAHLKNPRSNGFNWRPAIDLAKANPGEWVCIDDAPGVSRTVIRRGEPSAFLPAGSFDATRSDGSLYIRYLGEPIEPWDQRFDGRTFDELTRSI